MTLTQKMLFPVRKMIAFAFDLLGSAFGASYGQMSRVLGGGTSHTGRIVTQDVALTCSTVWRCVNVISETIASLPKKLMDSRADGTFPADTDPLYHVIAWEPNSEMDAMTFWQTMIAHVLLWGNAYARVVRRTTTDGKPGDVIGLWPLLPNGQVTPMREKPGSPLFYRVNGLIDGPKDLPPSEIFHIHGLGFDGIQGYSVVAMARNSIGLAMIQEEYFSKYFAKGGRRPYLLEHPQKFKNDEEYKQFTERWNAGYDNPDSFHNRPVLEGGLKYQELGFSFEDAQFLQSRQFSIQEITRWFGLQPNDVGEQSHMQFSNVENLWLQKVKECYMIWAVRIEQAVHRQLILPEQKPTRYLKVNLDGLLRGDFLSRMQGYSIRLQNGIDSINEIRGLEDENPIEGGDEHHIQLNMGPLQGSPQPALHTIGKKPAVPAQGG